LKIQTLEERLRLEMIRKYGPKSETLNDAQLLLLELELGVSAAEVEAESEREPLPTRIAAEGKEPHKGQTPGTPGTAGQSATCGKHRYLHTRTMRMQVVRERYGSDRLRAE
jgi:hypothetical protein